jgi:hypothetical protein
MWSIPIRVLPGMSAIELIRSNATVSAPNTVASAPFTPNAATAVRPPITGRPSSESALPASGYSALPLLGSSDAIARGSLDGSDAAARRGTSGHFAGGVMAGVLLGLIGTIIVYASADADPPHAPIRPQPVYSDTSAAYTLAFRRAYDDRMRSKRKSSALAGGLLGTAALVAVVVNVAGSQ